MDSKIFVSGVVLALVVGLGLGGYFGREAGYEAARTHFQALLDTAYPPPPAVLYRLSGEVRSVVGATINLSVESPDDYLPHPDGSPREVELRRVGVRAGTELVFFDYLNLDEVGNPAVREMEFSEVLPGDRLIVESDENIRNVERFDVTRVEKILF